MADLGLARGTALQRLLRVWRRGDCRSSVIIVALKEETDRDVPVYSEVVLLPLSI